MKNPYRALATGICAVAVAVSGLAVATTTPAVAESTSAEESTSVAECSWSGDMTLDPYASMVRSTFNFDTVDTYPDLGDIAVDCTGAVDGYPVTGRGGYSEWGTITNGTCTDGSGTGTYEAWIPTTGGVRYVHGTFYLQYAGTTGTESDPDGGMTAHFYFFPQNGDCTTERPLRSFHIDQNQTFTTSTINT